MIVLLGVRFKANPTPQQKLVLNQWMGCAKVIWNAKYDEERYHSAFARRFCPIGTYEPIDQKTAQFKHRELTPYLYDCPSQILRNSAANWYQTYRKFIKGQCGKPRFKKKSDLGSVYLTRELFRFDKSADSLLRLFIGSKTNNIGYLSFKAHRSFQLPKSITIRRYCGRYSVSFCYQEASHSTVEPNTQQQHLEYLKGSAREFLEQYTVGIDRGVAIPVQAGDSSYDFTSGQKRNKLKAQAYIKRLQQRLSRQDSQNRKAHYQGSKRRQHVQQRLSRQHQKIANIRNCFCHTTSKALIDSSAKIIVFESLKTAKLTLRPKVKQDLQGRYLANRARAKAGLNASILDKGWHAIETMTRYKAERAGKALFLVSANYTSQECAHCHHTHPENRQTQSKFVCLNCAHIDNADRNASLVIKQRAINLLLHSGTELSKQGLLFLPDTGRGSQDKSVMANGLAAQRKEAPKKKPLSMVGNLLA